MSDLTSRQAEIEALNDKFTIIGKTNAIVVQDYIRRVNNRLYDLPSVQPERKWIPCSERLPEDGTEVFVYLFNRQSPYIAWVTDSCWFTEDFQVEKENYPTAWMPLPEPWKGEEDETD